MFALIASGFVKIRVAIQNPVILMAKPKISLKSTNQHRDISLTLKYDKTKHRI
ncbi:hypothetical protein [Helicobacter sp. 23-1046]